MAGTREIPNQLISGREMPEGEMFKRLAEHLRHSAELARGIANSRKEIRWLAVAGILEETREKSILLMNLRQLKLPPLTTLERESMGR